MANILIVDDSKTLRTQLKQDLSEHGHHVVEAADGEQGLKSCAEDGPFDLIIADLNMPVCDGLSMTTEIRASDAGRTLPIIMLTSEGGVSTKQIGREIGVTAWIVKPYDRERLLGAVDQVVDGANAAP